MKTPRDRLGRKSRCLLALLTIVAAASFCLPALASAETGGAAPTATTATPGGIAFSPLRSAAATWYGPGLYGRQTACGQMLQPQTIGVAHRDLPCGTTVKLRYHGRQLITRVIDRGPYSAGFDWDLTNGARQALGFEGSGRIRYAVALTYARAGN